MTDNGCQLLVYQFRSGRDAMALTHAGGVAAVVLHDNRRGECVTDVPRESEQYCFRLRQNLVVRYEATLHRSFSYLAMLGSMFRNASCIFHAASDAPERRFSDGSFDSGEYGAGEPKRSCFIESQLLLMISSESFGAETPNVEKASPRNSRHMPHTTALRSASTVCSHGIAGLRRSS